MMWLLFQKANNFFVINIHDVDFVAKSLESKNAWADVLKKKRIMRVAEERLSSG